MPNNKVLENVLKMMQDQNVQSQVTGLMGGPYNEVPKPVSEMLSDFIEKDVDNKQFQALQDLVKLAKGKIGPFKTYGDITSTLKEKLGMVPEKIEELHSQMQPYRGEIGMKPLDVSKIPQKAEGGNMEKQPYIVGEKGPELMVPKEDGYVLPDDITAEIERKKGESVSQHNKRLKALCSKMAVHLHSGSSEGNARADGGDVLSEALGQYTKPLITAGAFLGSKNKALAENVGNMTKPAQKANQPFTKEQINELISGLMPQEGVGSEAMGAVGSIFNFGKKGIEKGIAKEAEKGIAGEMGNIESLRKMELAAPAPKKTVDILKSASEEAKKYSDVASKFGDETQSMLGGLFDEFRNKVIHGIENVKYQDKKLNPKTGLYELDKLVRDKETETSIYKQFAEPNKEAFFKKIDQFKKDNEPTFTALGAKAKPFNDFVSHMKAMMDKASKYNPKADFRVPEVGKGPDLPMTPKNIFENVKPSAKPSFLETEQAKELKGVPKETDEIISKALGDAVSHIRASSGKQDTTGQFISTMYHNFAENVLYPASQSTSRHMGKEEGEKFLTEIRQWKKDNSPYFKSLTDDEGNLKKEAVPFVQWLNHVENMANKSLSYNRKAVPKVAGKPKILGVAEKDVNPYMKLTNETSTQYQQRLKNIANKKKTPSGGLGGLQ